MEKSDHSLLDQGIPTHSFTISTEIARSNLFDFPRFLIKESKGGRLGSIAAGDFDLVAGKGGKFLVFKAVYYQENYSAFVRIKLESPIIVEIFSRQGENKNFAKRLEDYLLLSLQFFEEAVRKDTLYISFIPGVEETSKIVRRGRLAQRFLTGNMLNLILLFLVMSMVLFLLFQETLGPMLFALMMLVLLISIMLSAGKIIALRSEWRITKKHPEIAIVEYNMRDITPSLFLRQYRNSLSTIKKEIYHLVTFENKKLNQESVSQVFARSGIPSVPEQIKVKQINVYDIVSQAAKRFNMSVPTVAITRNPMPNAAATGFTKHFATMLITIGLLIQLDEKEIELVAGHELSHLRSGDPAILFSIFGAEYVTRVYILTYTQGIIQDIWAQFFLIYIIFLFYAIFFFGKLLESRADLEAALILRDPKTMATSLKKIGFRRLSLDTRFIEGKETSFNDWMAFDPHPPIGFRIRRLEELDLDSLPKHTFLKSVSDVFHGISRAIKS